MSQEIDLLAARVAGVVKDEIAQAELRGRTAGEAAGREEGKREGKVLRDELEAKVVALTQENDGLRERLGRAEARIDAGGGPTAPYSPTPPVRAPDDIAARIARAESQEAAEREALERANQSKAGKRGRK